MVEQLPRVSLASARVDDLSDDDDDDERRSGWAQRRYLSHLREFQAYLAQLRAEEERARRDAEED